MKRRSGYLLNKASGVLHLALPPESCNSDQINRRDRQHFAEEEKALVADAFRRHCKRCFAVEG